MSRVVVTVPDMGGNPYDLFDAVASAHGGRWIKVRSYTAPDGRRVHDITLRVGGAA
jgi:hypothetical protein